MDPFSELTAAPVPITISGQTWYLSPLRLIDWAEAARLLASRRKSPLAIVQEHLSSLPGELARHLVDLAYRDERSGELFALEEVERWFATPEGNVYRMWLMLRRRHPALTLAQTEELLLLESESERRELTARQADEGASLPNAGFFSPTGEASSANSASSTGAGVR